MHGFEILRGECTCFVQQIRFFSSGAPIFSHFWGLSLQSPPPPNARMSVLYHCKEQVQRHVYQRHYKFVRIRKNIRINI